MLNSILKILEDKGYHILVGSSFNKSRTTCLNDCLLELINNNELKLNSNVERIINMHSTDSITIIFKEHYEFDVLPNNFNYSNNELYFCLECWKKNAQEIENIEKKQLEILSSWANQIKNAKLN